MRLRILVAARPLFRLSRLRESNSHDQLGPAVTDCAAEQSDGGPSIDTQTTVALLMR